MISVVLASMLARPIDDTDVFLSKVRSTYHAVTSALFYVRFTATDSKGVEGHGEVRYEYLAPNCMRGAFKGLAGGMAVLLCDGHRIGTFASAGKRKVVPFSVESLTALIPTNVETLAFFNGNHVLSRERGCEMFGSELSVLPNQDWHSKHWTVLREINRKDAVQVDYYIDPETNFIWRTVGEDLKTHKKFTDTEIIELNTKAKLNSTRFKIPEKI